MAYDNWQKVKEIFTDALRHTPEARPQFLDSVCSGDKILRSEVESLLTSFDSAESFMETPAVSDITESFTDRKVLKEGFCFGHYEIIKQIGTGGMGEVYLANDKKLDRKVAVKILNERFSAHESNLERFIREAKAASSLNHPNILVIHEIGETDNTHYIVSEFVEGKTLRDIFNEKRLELKEILDISIQIANALSVAHEARLIHRDIKPENIMIRPDGLVKILDFGLAKLIIPNSFGLEESTVRQNDTAQGVIIGTVNYMSPEQAKGEKVDERTDIFSFGGMIYEMIAGRTPFAGDSMSETFANLIKSEPLALSYKGKDVPDNLQRIILKTLNKNKAERYQTMKDLLADVQDLRENLVMGEFLEKKYPSENETAANSFQSTTGDANRQTVVTQPIFSSRIKLHKSFGVFTLVTLFIGAIFFGYYYLSLRKTVSSANGKRSIAVLPLKPVNTNDRDLIYELGIAESLINKLGSVKGLTVRPLSATRKYSDIEQDAIVAGREQQVDYVLASNYQIAEGKIRVTSQFINVQTGSVEEFFKSEKDTANKFSMQDAVVNDIGNPLLARFGSREINLTAERGTTNEEAYRLYLKAEYIFVEFNDAEIGNAIEYLEQSVKLDPNYAEAYVELAYAYQHYQWIWSKNIPSEKEYYLKSKEAIEKALALDENSADAHAVSGFIKSGSEHDFAGAEKEYRRAIELNPDSEMAHGLYASYLSNAGRFDEALAERKKAIEIYPASVVDQITYGMILYYAHRYPEAYAHYKKMLEKNENSYYPYFWLWVVSDAQGNEAEAYEWFIKYQTQFKTDPETIRLYQTAYQKSGYKGLLREVIKQDEKTIKLDNNPDLLYEAACFYAKLGNNDKAFENLDRAYERRRSSLNFIKVDPSLDSLHDDPRFEQLVKRIGLN